MSAPSPLDSAAGRRCLLRLHRAQTPAQLGAATVALVRALLPLRAVALSIHTLERDHPMFFPWPPGDPIWSRWFDQGGRDIDPWFNSGPIPPGQKICRLSDLVPDAEIIKTEYYRVHCEPQNMRYGSMLHVWEGRHLLALVHLLRGTADGDFADAEQAMLLEALPHIDSAVKHVHRLHRERAARRALAGVVRSMPSGVLVLDWRRQLVDANAAALEACARWSSGGTMRPGKGRGAFALPAAIDEACRALAATKSERSRAVRGAGVPPLARAEVRLIRAEGAPMSRWQFLVRLNDAAAAPGPGGRRDWAKDPRLTTEERRAVLLVGAGRTNAQIAHTLGKSPATVRNQLHAVFEKLGVKRRHELVAGA